jgi:hypothetical protein
VVHSASEAVPWASRLDRTPEKVRELGTTPDREAVRWAIQGPHATLRDATQLASDSVADEEDNATIALFDQYVLLGILRASAESAPRLLRQEDYNIFTTRRAALDSDDEYEVDSDDSDFQ